MKSVVHHELLEHEGTITEDWLNETLCQKCLALINRKYIIFQHDNTGIHSTKKKDKKKKKDL